MKIRKGFVSNSSSSSFVVSLDPKKSSKIKVTIEVDIEQYANFKIKNINDLNRLFLEYYGMPIRDLKKNKLKLYNDCKKEIESGNVVLCGSFSSDGDPEENFLCENGIPKDLDNIKIICNEPGY